MTKFRAINNLNHFEENENFKDEPIEFIKLFENERGSGPIRLGPFMLIVSVDYLAEIKKNEMPKEAYGL